MNAVRGLLRDLVERRLWPVAVVLLIAAVAVPLYLGRSAGVADAPPVPSAQGAAKTSKAAVTLEDPAADDARPGGVHDPFKQLHVPKSTDTKAAAAAPSPTTPPSSGAAGGSGAGGSGAAGPVPPTSSGGSGGSGTTTPPKATGDPLDTYHLTLRFGQADAASLKTYPDVARLSPLPTAENPFFVYTGVLKDGKTAVFLLSSDATATGDGHCRPSAKSCETIEVKEGDTEFFDLTVNGQPIQYQLDVVRVFKKGAGTAVAASAASVRHSTAGAGLLRRAHRLGTSSFQGAADYRWLPETGVLVRTPRDGKVRASVNGATAASAADAAGALPGIPVWRWQLDG